MLQGAEERLLGSQDLDGGSRVFGKSSERARVGDELGSDGFTDETGEVGGYDFHAALEVALDLGSELEHAQSLLAEVLQALDVEVADLLAHRVVGGFDHAFGHLTVPDDLLNLLGSDGSGGSVSNKVDESHEELVVADNPVELGEMPGVPLLDPHGEGVDVLIEQFQQSDGLDDGLVLPVDVELDLVAGEGVGETEPGLLELHVLKLLVLEEAEEVLSEATDELRDDSGGGGLDLERLVDEAGQFHLTDAQLDLGLLLEGEVLGEEVDELRRSLAGERVVDDLEGHCG